jgi:hypothetical protein
MDFIEQLFNLAPDGGNGTLEAAYAACAAFAVGTLVFRRRIITFAKVLVSAIFSQRA